ncbi:MAG: RNA polymerase sigma-70 factor [Bacteroidales bacterium]|nr:RNA polymerase sigma-70 factor [Bacteroidales bacterium]
MSNLLFNRIKAGNIKAYQELFNKYYDILCRYAYLYVPKEDIAKEIVQEFFIKVWEKRSSINIKTSVKAYLFNSVRNASLNYIRTNKRVEFIQINNIEHEITNEISDIEKLDKEYISEQIAKAINSLPPKCKKIFLLSKESKLTYNEIAKELNISKKTVENQMGIAFKKLKEKLSPLLFLFIYSFFE